MQLLNYRITKAGFNCIICCFYTCFKNYYYIFKNQLIKPKHAAYPLMNINIKPLICFTLLLFAANSYAQQRAADSGLYQLPVNNAIAHFKQVLGVQSGLYNGQEYVPYSRLRRYNVFFRDALTWDKGTVTYDGMTYTDVPMIYDLYKNVLVVQLYNITSSYTLITEKITDFTLLNHHFVYKYAENGLEAGLYDQLYSGKTEILVKRKRTLFITSGSLNTFPEDDQVFVKSGNIYYPAGNQHTLLSILKNKRKELRKYINDNNIVFKDAQEQATVRVVVYYDKLTP